jgi:hypothetical protein
MTKARYSIWVREHGSDHDVELCALNSNPKEMVSALYAKRLKLGKGRAISKYDSVRVVDNEDGKKDPSRPAS